MPGIPGFSDRLKAARRSKGLVQQQMGEKLGHTSHSTYAWYEDGKNHFPPLDTFKSICAILEVSSDYILGIASGENHDAEISELLEAYMLLGPHERQLTLEMMRIFNIARL